MNPHTYAQNGRIGVYKTNAPAVLATPRSMATKGLSSMHHQSTSRRPVPMRLADLDEIVKSSDYPDGATGRERFWALVDRKGCDECWPWQGSPDAAGYGKFAWPKRPGWVKASRVSYLIAYGEFDEALFVCHSCDNPPCVNPHHLFLDTAQGNTDDKIRKDRARYVPLRGERNGRARLSSGDVRQIRMRRSSGESARSLAETYNISESHIRRIVRGTRWASEPEARS